MRKIIRYIVLIEKHIPRNVLVTALSIIIMLIIIITSIIKNSMDDGKKKIHPFDINKETCYTIGVAYGACKTRKKNNLACEAGTDFVMPIKCEGEENTRKGIEAGTQLQKNLIYLAKFKQEQEILSEKRTNAIIEATHYLKSNLRDPDSYESIQWGTLNELKNGSYSISNTYRAKNGFGGINVEEKTFLFSKDGYLQGME